VQTTAVLVTSGFGVAGLTDLLPAILGNLSRYRLIRNFTEQG
jgi:hypothetical protein